MVEHWSPKPGVGGSSPSWPAIRKGNCNMEKLTTYFKHVREEIQKVIFPTKLQIKQAFIAVFIVVTVISIFLALVDMLMSAIVSTAVGN